MNIIKESTKQKEFFASIPKGFAAPFRFFSTVYNLENKGKNASDVYDVAEHYPERSKDAIKNYSKFLGTATGGILSGTALVLTGIYGNKNLAEFLGCAWITCNTADVGLLLYSTFKK